MNEKRTETVTIKTSPSIAKQIDELAKKYEWTRSKTTEKLITLALEKEVLK